ncbi:hypothetical protein CPB84DRAFT_1785006 [Gymnopilus junonius]|uniref:Uncharacterized protein n=1 Tax=Gymnopilus junonius TaxID=109634 RepID=A0A9P5NGT0_GYMJU|nr:hypothetical protein CPB84DRAFT_1785006 [Gymnopilus junonius]
MRQMLYLIFCVIFHVFLFFQPAFCLPVTVTLARRVEVPDLAPQAYAGQDHEFGGPTFYHHEIVGHHLSPSEVEEAVKHAYTLIKDHQLPQLKPHQQPKHLVMAALYVPHQHTIHYASQPLGAGYRHFQQVKNTHGWPGVVNEQNNLHAEGHAVLQAMAKGAHAEHLRGTYMGLYGHFEHHPPQKISPCHGGGRDAMTNCHALLSHLKINTRKNNIYHHH